MCILEDVYVSLEICEVNYPCVYIFRLLCRREGYFRNFQFPSLMGRVQKRGKSVKGKGKRGDV
mgnify:FL=1